MSSGPVRDQSDLLAECSMPKRMAKMKFSTSSWNPQRSMPKMSSREISMAINLQPLLLEALSSRLGSATDPALLALLSGTSPIEAAGALPSTEELLAQLESTNPTMALIAKYLAARQASESEISEA